LNGFYYFCLVNRLTGISLLFVYLFAVLVPASVKDELGKLDQLIAHYIEHKAETPELSFFSFIQLHYGEEFAEHQSDHNHADLPGKESPDHAHALACGCYLPALPAQCALAFGLPAFAKHIPFPAGDQLISSLYASGIWQPPRQA